MERKEKEEPTEAPIREIPSTATKTRKRTVKVEVVSHYAIPAMDVEFEMGQILKLEKDSEIFERGLKAGAFKKVR